MSRWPLVVANAANHSTGINVTAKSTRKFLSMSSDLVHPVAIEFRKAAFPALRGETFAPVRRISNATQDTTSTRFGHEAKLVSSLKLESRSRAASEAFW